MKNAGNPDSGIYFYEEEVTSTSTSPPGKRATTEITNDTSVSAIQSILRSACPVSGQIRGREKEKRNRYCESQLLGGGGLPYVDANGDRQVRIGRLPTAGPPPESDPEGTASSASSPASGCYGEGEKGSKPSLKVLIKTPKRKLKGRPLPRHRAGSKDKPVKNASVRSEEKLLNRQALSAREKVLNARLVEVAEEIDERAQRKLRRKARKIRKQQFVQDLLAFQEEMNNTAIELEGLIAAGKAKIAQIQERRRLRAQRREARMQRRAMKVAYYPWK